MEVEIKLRLPDRASYEKVADLLKGTLKAVHDQENYFFDGPNKELSSQRVVLRCRFYNKDAKAEIACKGKLVIKDGISRGLEEQFPTDPKAAREFLTSPGKILALENPLIARLTEEYGVKDLVSLGGFENLRREFDFQGFKLELDETKYEWGTVYEIEIETEEPEELKPKLEAWLQENGVPYTYTTNTKFANFINRTLI
eukprot:jgi/Botrbrau1/3397/Bobra.0337s0036.3